MTALLVVLVVLALVGAVAGIAVAQQRGRARDNQVVPGRPTRAPASWAGAHSAEARLHRRLRDAVRALAALPDVDVTTRGEVEGHVLDLDDRLVAVAALPADQRQAPLRVLAEQVEAVEHAVGRFATDGLDGSTDARAGLDALSERLGHLAAAHAELDALEQQGSGPDLDALADRLDAERAAREAATRPDQEHPPPDAAERSVPPEPGPEGRPLPGTG